ncbi:hypothetical protein L6164_021616 [Bauhinia variegata]|uniref:Uncharacterized protein n=1 Tax=Bauhinia variegata TaxID=167791 RepID=A0ACB9N0I9_BAUVA|nr:hypothetical protein L6164_021616 [Bauhinia variegata]
MNMQMSFAIAFAGALALVLQCAAAQTLHVVGDSIGWTIPQNGAAAYQTWSSNNKFVVGDILQFNFQTNAHDVLEVQKESYDSCSSDKPIGSAFNTGPANITLSSAGEHYYICSVGQHCQNGQKLAITVSASPGPTSAPGPVGGGPSPNSAAGVFASFFLLCLSLIAGTHIVF